MDEINFFRNDSNTQAPEITRTSSEPVADFGPTIQNANINGNIPLRFAKSRFSDHEKECTEAIKEFCLKKHTDQVCILSGPCGNGKTYLSCSAMHERAVNGLSAGLYLSCRVLKPKIKSTYSFSSKVSEMDLYQRYAETPFLVIDEVGKCADSQLEWEFLTTIIAMRYDNRLPTMMTTNFTFPQFKNFIVGDNKKGEDIYDRLNSVVLPIALNEASWRK